MRGAPGFSAARGVTVNLDLPYSYNNFKKIADFYEDEVDAAVAGLVKLLEPLLIFILGIVIAIVLAIGGAYLFVTTGALPAGTGARGSRGSACRSPTPPSTPR